jgi:catechol 2,3-dioxygenase-like lactoylglutathione lyase family enzyme
MKRETTLKKSSGIFLKALILTLIVSAQGIAAIAQTPIVRGMDHVGITVSDMDKAVKFFSEALGYKKVTEIGPINVDEGWRKTYHLRQGSNPQRIVSLRGGNGSNIELFQFDSSNGSKEQPYQDDAGWYHIAFYTDDIDKAVALLKSKGIRIIGEIFRNTEGPTSGESWVYFESPWGTQMELNSYPAGKGYEKGKPAVKLWSPKDFPNVDTAGDVDSKGIRKLLETHLGAFMEKDAVKRSAMIAGIYAPEVKVIDPHAVFSGQEKLNSFIGNLLARYPKNIFKLAKPIESHHNIARLFWKFGPPSDPSQITGQDVFIIADGKIQELFVFLDVVKK